MHKRLYRFLEKNNCFYDIQFGFRLNVSIYNALLSIIENIQTHLDNKEIVAGIYIDLKKAFDTVESKVS